MSVNPPREDSMIAERTNTVCRSRLLKLIGYWGATALVAFAMIVGGVMDIARPAPVVAFFNHLGYPAYFAAIIGVWKVLGGIVVLAPRVPLIKEWAYAGIFFDLTGAAVSHALMGDSPSDVVVPVVLTGLALASWALRSRERRLGAIADVLDRKLVAARIVSNSMAVLAERPDK
jgi:uncharacterized membrane protein YphA (DoxX/SURF4 family)